MSRDFAQRGGMSETASKTAMLTTSPPDIARAAELLSAGVLVAFPTETVYGLGADATNPQAIASLYAAKGRPQFNPLIAHVAALDQALALGLFSPQALRLAARFWPGPLTLVVPVHPHGTVCDLARAGLDSVAIRVPDHPVARALLMAANRPIAAPSANRSGHVSASTARHVQDDLGGRIAAIVDGGASPIGVESTILACLDDRITMLRPGGLARADLETALGAPIHDGVADADAPRAPGRLTSHYAPRHALRLNGREIRPGEALLDFGGKGLPGSAPVATRDLSPSGNLTEAAANLYTSLRELDSIPNSGIVVSPLPRDGLGEAIEDRLIRAAAPRA